MRWSPSLRTLSSKSVAYSKYSGCGNDFVMVDNRDLHWEEPPPQAIIRLCDPKVGVGADGVIFLEQSPFADLRMRIFNADGSEAEMCGNGLRCLLRFSLDLGLAKREVLVQTKERLLKARQVGRDIEVEMGDPCDVQWQREVLVGAKSIALDVLNTGVPHAVLFVKDVAQAPLESLGPGLRHHPDFFPKGLNVNFVEVTRPNSIAVRTYERGVERETLACGTGATAAALAYAYHNSCQSPVSVTVASGEKLLIRYDFRGNSYENVSLQGPAHKVSEGHFPSHWLPQASVLH